MEPYTKQELTAFGTLAKETFLSVEMEGLILKELQRKQLIHSSKNRTVMKKTIIGLAASISLLVLGYYLGTYRQGIVNGQTSKPMFALFLYENKEFKVSDPQSLVSEYMQWAIRLQQEKRLAYAEKLEDDNVLWLGSPTVRNQTSTMTGYFVFYAENIEEAQRIADSHPHVGYGGGLELRSIELLD